MLLILMPMSTYAHASTYASTYACTYAHASTYASTYACTYEFLIEIGRAHV